MTGFIRRRPIISGVAGFFLLLLLLLSFPVVPETKQAVIVLRSLEAHASYRTRSR